jgi:hypothetical protein
LIQNRPKLDGEGIMARYLKIAGLVVASALMLVIVGVGAAIAYDVLFSGRSAEQFANTQYSDPGGSTLHAYVAAPA